MIIKYLKNSIRWDLNYGRHILQKLLEGYSDQRLYTILDIGAGSGADLNICRQRLPESNFFAIESYAPNIELLKGSGVEVFKLNLEVDEFPNPNESVDLIIANQILEHCKEVFWIFNEISRVLKIGGVCYIGVPNLASLHSRLLLLFGRHPTCIKISSAHIRGFTKIDFIDFLNICAPGLYDLELFEGSNFYPFPGWLARPLAKLLPNSAVSLFFVIKKKRVYKNEFINYPKLYQLETNFWLGADHH